MDNKMINDKSITTVTAILSKTPYINKEEIINQFNTKIAHRGGVGDGLRVLVWWVVCSPYHF